MGNSINQLITAILILMISICTSFVVIVNLNRDLSFYFAKEYAGKVKQPITGIADLKYMIRSLKAYNAYVRKKLSGRFDEYLLLSRIIINVHDHEKNSFLGSFTTPNGLGPLIYLAKIMEGEKNQTILVAEGLSDKLKRFNTFILPIGSLGVAVISLIITGMK